MRRILLPRSDRALAYQAPLSVNNLRKPGITIGLKLNASQIQPISQVETLLV